MSQSVFTTFYLEDQLFGLDIRFVREINRQLELSPVPHASGYIRGLINLRGQIVTVMDLKRRLGFDTTSLTDTTHNLIIKTDSELLSGPDLGLAQELSIPDKVGLLVDRIGDIVSVSEDAIAPPPANVGKLDGQYLDGVATLKEGILTILSMNAILKGAN